MLHEIFRQMASVLDEKVLVRCEHFSLPVDKYHQLKGRRILQVCTFSLLEVMLKRGVLQLSMDIFCSSEI